jgi:hypothetical protein
MSEVARGLLRELQMTVVPNCRSPLPSRFVVPSGAPLSKWLPLNWISGKGSPVFYHRFYKKLLCGWPSLSDLCIWKANHLQLRLIWQAIPAELRVAQ